ncbi:hypothetical protein XthCFBP4691_07420 [Xanthomonas theicola]|uniref:Transposase DDE domain-containing protein n=1 Tax=Xanthomonas theicola TaxID=56464 RepID=A0A2S6ZGR0_9XANT|nr:hypothetical protein XthCFBP4691_07420 [Xanthomonas theicola]QNH24465.1 hypothetical protein G4Q83_06475 [Xanthomonas theicola]
MIALSNEVLEIADGCGGPSGEHFRVDATLIQAWAGHKRFKRKDGDDEDGDDFRGQSRSNATHVSTRDADARLHGKGNRASELRYSGRTLRDNRHGLIANARARRADGDAEREAAKAMIADAGQAAAPEAVLTRGADKGDDAAALIQALDEPKLVPHVAQNTSGRRSAAADAVAASEGHARSRRKGKLIEQGVGWARAVGRIRQAMVRGLEKVHQTFVPNMAAYNLVRMRTLG